MINYYTILQHMTPNPTTILHRTNIVHVGIVNVIIVIEINKTNFKKIIKILNYVTIRTSYNLTTIRSSS